MKNNKKLNSDFFNRNQSLKTSCNKKINGLKCGYIEKNIHKRILFLGIFPLINTLKKAERLGWKVIYRTEKISNRGNFFYEIQLLCPDCAKKY